MDNIIFERDYTHQEPTSDKEHTDVIFNQVIDGEFFKAYAEAMDKLPKVIVWQDKENYEYLLERLDEYAKANYGRIKGIVDYRKWESHIEVFLSFLEFGSPEELDLMKEISEKAHTVTVEPCEEGVRLHIRINYFEDLVTDEEHDFLQFHAIMQDKELASMLGISPITEDEQYYAEQLNAVLERFEENTDYDRMTVIRALLREIAEYEKDEQTPDLLVSLAEKLFEETMNTDSEE